MHTCTHIHVHVHAHGVTATTLTKITFQGDTLEHPEFADPLSQRAGDAIHPALRSRRVWFTRLAPTPGKLKSNPLVCPTPTWSGRGIVGHTVDRCIVSWRFCTHNNYNYNDMTDYISARGNIKFINLPQKAGRQPWKGAYLVYVFVSFLVQLFFSRVSVGS